MIIGLTGKMGSGKDTVYSRLLQYLPLAERRAFADPLKDSVAALLKLTREEVDALKLDPRRNIHVVIGNEYRTQSMREFLQRYGTEAHRDVFGHNFWLDATLPHADYSKECIVITDVRFDNEAERVLACGGKVWRVEGIDDETGGHASEAGVSDRLVSYILSNKVRSDQFAALDREIEAILDKMGVYHV